MTWIGAGDAERVPDGHGGKPLVAVAELGEGDHHDLMLVLDADADERADPVPGRGLERHRGRVVTSACPSLPSTIAPRDARHAYAVLSGLTSAGGGMVAAATMSLPERARQGRNYDYRYVWIRDQCFAGQAVAQAGPLPLLDDAVRFVSDRLLADGDHLAPAYTVDGDPVPDERSLDLPGYPGGADIVGNWVNRQFQLDAFGESLALFAEAAAHDRLDADGWRAADVAAAAIKRRWREPDGGIWELEPDAGPTAGSSAPPVCAASAPTSLRGARPTGWPWPTPSSPTPRATPCTHAAAGSVPRMMTASTRRCCCPSSAAASRPMTPGRWPRCTPSPPS